MSPLVLVGLPAEDHKTAINRCELSRTLRDAVGQGGRVRVVFEKVSRKPLKRVRRSLYAKLGEGISQNRHEATLRLKVSLGF